MATLSTPLAVLAVPRAVLNKPVACALSPMATDEKPLAAALKPKAELLVPLAVALGPHATASTPVAVAPAPVWGSSPVVLTPQTNCAPARGAATTSPIAAEKMAQLAKRAVRRRRRLFGMMTPPRDRPLWRRKRNARPTA
jgi:hypothetical protein